MKPVTRHIATMSFLAGLLLPVAAFAQSDSELQRLREQLRQTTTQLRAAQDDAAAAKVRMQAQDRELEALRAAAPAQSASPPHHDESARLRAALSKAQRNSTSLQQQLDQLTQERDQARDKLQAVTASLQADQRRAADLADQQHARLQHCQSDNAALVGIANELLQRYENKGVWSALLDKEPLTQLHRVQLQNLAQDYRDKLDAHDQAGASTPPISGADGAAR